MEDRDRKIIIRVGIIGFIISILITILVLNFKGKIDLKKYREKLSFGHSVEQEELYSEILDLMQEIRKNLNEIIYYNSEIYLELSHYDKKEFDIEEFEKNESYLVEIGNTRQIIDAKLELVTDSLKILYDSNISNEAYKKIVRLKVALKKIYDTAFDQKNIGEDYETLYMEQNNEFKELYKNIVN